MDFNYQNTFSISCCYLISLKTAKQFLFQIARFHQARIQDFRLGGWGVMDLEFLWGGNTEKLKKI